MRCWIHIKNPNFKRSLGFFLWSSASASDIVFQQFSLLSQRKIYFRSLSRHMPYQYSFDRTTLGNAWWYKKTYVFYQKGLKTLRTLLDAWKEKAGTDNHPYEREVKDLTTMIEWGDDRLKQIDDSGEIHISGISRGSLRYLKAAATLQVIEKEKQIAAREQEGFSRWCPRRHA